MASFNKKPLATAFGTALLAGAIAPALADSNPFAATELSAGYDLANYSSNADKAGESEARCGGKHEGEAKCGEAKCGEAKCGAEKAEQCEGKCGEGKCGGAKPCEGKCGEGKCGAEKASAEGKCGEGKCGN